MKNHLSISCLCIGFLVLWAVIAPSIEAQEATCAWCGRPIVDRHVMYENRLYHEACYRDHVALRCDACGKVITGQYTVYGGKNYHDSCYRDQAAFRCDLCGEPVTGDYLTDYWGNRYCAHHEGKAPTCQYCGRFIGSSDSKGGVDYPDGRRVCNVCSASAVTDIEEAELILDEVRMRLGKLGIVVILDEITLHLTDRRHISRHYGSDMAGHSGFIEYEFESIGDYVSQQDFDIYILDGMPRMQFIATAAHELMHVWQYLNCPLNNDPALSEGSCNYAAVQVLRQIGGPECQYIIESLNRSVDPIYGAGYRRVARFAESKGDWTWLEHLKISKTFPEGY
ncbi:hypothetical protein GF377_04805 [candidate division GN15 bacterium]|nr:hypothetical protein [candidate division GN15 bacterium]